MKNKNLMILLLCALVLGGLLLALQLLQSGPASKEELAADSLGAEDTGEASMDLTAYFSDFSELSVYSSTIPINDITVAGPYGNYTIAKESDSYTIAGFGELVPINQDMLAATISSAASLPGQRILQVDKDTQLAQYGLDAAAVKAVLTFDDDTVIELLVEDDPTEEVAYVLAQSNKAEGGEGYIYQVPIYSVQGYLLRSYDYIRMEITASTGSAQAFGKLELEGGPRVEAVVVELDAANSTPESPVYSVTTPIVRGLDPTDGNSIVQSLFSLSADAAVAADPTEEVLAQFGLTEPYATATVTGSPLGSFTLHTSAPDTDGNVFILREGVPVIYRMTAAAMPWLDAQVYDVVSDYPIFLSMGKLAGLTVQVESDTYSFNVTGPADESGNYTVTMDGATVDYETFYTLLTAALDMPHYFHDAPAAVPTSPLAAITYRYNDGRPDDTITLYQANARQLYLQKNAEPMEFLVSSTTLDWLLETLDAITQ